MKSETQEIHERALETRRAYYREWRKKNPDKVKEYRDRYWIKRSQKEQEGNEGER